MNIKKLSTISVLIALCLVLTYVEILIPLNLAIPGVKLGLANAVVLFALYRLDYTSAFFINLARILISGLVFTSPTSMVFSLFGGLFSFLIMSLVIKINFLSVISTSISGSIVHNIAQVAVGCFYWGASAVLLFLPFLILFGLLSGLVTGFITLKVMQRIDKI